MKKLVRILLGLLIIHLNFLSVDVLANPFKITKTEVLNGITYNFIEGIDGVIVGRPLEPYKGDIVIPNLISIYEREYHVLGIFYNAFCCSPYLESIDIQCKVNAIYKDQFFNCYNLKTVKLPESIVYIGSYAFCHCHKLSDIKIPKNTKFINEGAFAFCYQLLMIDMPPKLVYVGERTFEKCYGLKEVHIPGEVKEIKEKCFLECVNLEKIVFGEKISVIGEEAFFNCQNLESPIFPPNLIKIKDKAFQNCTLIQKISFPSSLTFIGWDAFSDCNQLNSIQFLGSSPPHMGTDAFYYRKDSHFRMVDVVTPKGSEKKYKSALRWKMHDSRYIVKPPTEANND